MLEKQQKYFQLIFLFHKKVLKDLLLEGQNFEYLQNIKFFKHFFKTIKVWLKKADKITEFAIDQDSFVEIFAEMYEKIFKKYFNMELLAFFEFISIKLTGSIHFKVLKWILNLWFKINSLQWWWYQLYNQINLEDNSQFLKNILTSLTNAFIYCLSDIFVVLDLEDIQMVPGFQSKIKLLRQQLNQLNNCDEYYHILQIGKDITPNQNLEEIIHSQNLSDFYRFIIAKLIIEFKPMFGFVDSLQKNQKNILFIN